MLRSPANITSEVSQERRSQMTAQTTTLSQILSRVEFADKNNHRLTRETIVKCIEEENKKAIEKSRKKEGGQVVENTDTIQCSCAKLRLEYK
jgi:hypothetical protein